jgi:hypothetical protein
MSVRTIKDLRGKFGDARDQGQRLTCMAFAASDSHSKARGGTFVHLSTEYLYYQALHLNSPPPYGQAVSLANVTKALALPGQPLEISWPYLPALPADISHWVPPASITNYRATVTHLTATAEAIVDGLEKGDVALVTLDITESFFAPDVEGVVATIVGERVAGRHAAVVVGYGTQHCRTVLLIRNSWGPTWGIGGYGWLDECYLRTHLRTVSIVTAVF